MRFNIDIELSDQELKDAIKQEAAKQFYAKYSEEHSAMIREIKAAVRDIIYENKDEIIDRAVDQAAKEFYKKGLSRLVTEISKSET